jgi:NADH pyrophosphatase NudC (nudix superfamily)
MIFAAASLLIVGVLVLTLVIRQKDLPAPEPVSPTLHLDERKKAIYENLRDLQFEYRMGKLSDQDYAETKLDLQRQLAVVLAEIEKVKGKTEYAPPAAAAAALAAKPKAACVCPHCAARFSQPMKFCGECGKAMLPA